MKYTPNGLLFFALFLFFTNSICAHNNKNVLDDLFFTTSHYHDYLKKAEAELATIKRKKGSSYQEALTKLIIAQNLIGNTQKAQSLVEKLMTKDNSIQVLHLATNIYIHQEHFTTADSLLQVIKLRMKSPQDSIYWYNNQSLLQIKRLEFKKAKEFVEAALRLEQQRSGKESMSYNWSLLLKAIAETRLNNFPQAAKDFGFVEKIFHQLLPENHLLKATFLYEKGELYQNRGDLFLAEQAFDSSIKMWEQIDLQQHKGHAVALGNLGALLIGFQKYGEADINLDKAGNITKENFPEHIVRGQYLINLAVLEHRQNNNDHALALTEQAANIFVNKQQWLYYGSTLLLKAGIYEFTEAYEKAGVFYQKSKDILEEHAFTYTTGYIDVLKSYAIYQAYEGKPAAADSLHQLALDLVKKFPLDNHYHTKSVLNSLGNMHSITGNISEAEQTYLAAKQLYEQQGDTLNIEYVILLQNLAGLYVYSKNEKQAHYYYDKSNRLNQNYIRQVYAGASANTRALLQGSLFDGISQYFSFALENNLPIHLADKVEDILLNIKNLSLDYTTETKFYAENKTDQNLYDEWLKVRENLSIAYQMTPNERKIANIKLQTAKQKKENLEIALLKKAHNINAASKLSAADIRKKLKKNEAAIDMYAAQIFDGNNWTDSVYYFVTINRPEWKEGKLIKLLERQNLKTHYFQAVDDFATITRAYISDTELSYDLYQKLWKPIEEHLDGVTDIYFSPSGFFQRASLAAISTNQEGTTHLGDQYNITYCADFRNWLKTKTQKNANTAVLIGNPIYGMDEATVNELNNNLPPLPDWEKYADIGFTYHEEEKIRASRGRYFGSIEETGEEVKKIASILNLNHWESSLLLDSMALEQTVKEYSARLAPSLLHIGTHGFYYKKTNLNNDEDYCQYLSGDNALIRAGIAMTGANIAMKDCKSDGILTALEISQLDLRNTKLVVLSACETAYGEIGTTEGVFGFYRAFRLAGVDQVILSLWSVENNATKQLMIYFYEFYAQNNQAALSLALAQKKLKSNPRYKNPKYWAGFILID